ncbi:hypothetical protein ACFSCX_07905 [Bacillus salitolerans]|uniref:Uncharacterized protein n=1 Tax=Bacillus salitolerans TaxID=1437434 RepID=A0ABW4LMU5_9BACI
MDSKLKELSEEYNSIVPLYPVFKEADKERIRERIQGNQMTKSVRHVFPRTVSYIVLAAMFILTIGIVGIKTELIKLGNMEEQPQSPTNIENPTETIKELTNEEKIEEQLSRQGLPHEGNNIFNPTTIKKGDFVAGWKLTEIDVTPGNIQYPYDMTKAHFDGKVTITGTIEHIPATNELYGNLIIFVPTEESAKLLPVSHHDTRNPNKWIMFENQEKAKELLQTSQGDILEGMKVTLTDYKVNFFESDILDSAMIEFSHGASSIMLSPELEDIYEAISKDFNKEHLRGLSPLEIFRLYYTAEERKDFRTQYELFIQDEQYVKVFETYDEYLEAVESDNLHERERILQNVITSDLVENIFIKEEIGEESARIIVVNLEMGFGLVKDAGGIWRVNWMPYQ